jgi:hypothetical protein
MTDNRATGLLTINRVRFGMRYNFAKILVKFTPDRFGDDKMVGLEGNFVCSPVKSASCGVFTDSDHHVTVNFICGRSKSVCLGCSPMPQNR